MQGRTKAELSKWAEGFSRTPATVLKAFIDAGLCSDQTPQREETRLFAHQPDSALVQAAQKLAPYLYWTIGPESPGHHPTMPSAVREFLNALDATGDA